MAVVKTTILERNEGLTTATSFETINTLKYNFFNDLITNKPSNWTLISSTIPTPSTITYQNYQATFEVDGAYRIQFRGYVLSDTTTPPGQASLWVYILDTSGNYLLGGSGQATTTNFEFPFINSISITAVLNIKIQRFLFSGLYDCYFMSGIYAYGKYRDFGKMYLDEKDTRNLEFCLYTSSASIGFIFPTIGSTANHNLIGTSAQLTKNGLIKFEKVYLVYSGVSPGVIKDAVSPNTGGTGYGDIGFRYQINSKVYIRLTNQYIFFPES